MHANNYLIFTQELSINDNPIVRIQYQMRVIVWKRTVRNGDESMNVVQMDIHEKIETLRNEMMMVYNQNGEDTRNPEVLKLSQLLDVQLNLYAQCTLPISCRM